MPTVPTYDSAQVMPGVGPAPYRQPAAIDNQAGARELGAAGEALQRVGAVLTQEEVNAQGMANQVLVDAGLNEAIKEKQRLALDPENGYANKKGAAALEPDPLGRPLFQRYTEDFQEKIKAISAGLGNDAQRRVFNQQAAGMVSQFSGDVQRHMLQEHRSFGLETQQGAIKLATDEAQLSWNDPERIGAQIRSAQAAVWKTGQINGEPANLVEAKMKDTTSAIHSRIIQTALQNDNPEYALAYIEQNKSGMTGDDLLRARAVVNKDAYQRIADGVATNAVSALRSKIQPSATIRIMEAAGVTDNTKGGGGAAYVNGLATKYAGDSSKVLAATAIDEDVVDAAIKAAGKGGDWTANLSAPNQAKLAAVVNAYNAPALPNKPTLLEVHDGVRAQITQRYGANPPAGVMKLALTAATQQFEDISKAMKAADDESVVAAMRALQQNGGRVSALPFEVRSRIPADKLDNVIAFGQKLAKGDDITNPAVYQRLSDPTALRKLSDNEFYQLRTELSDSDFKHFSAQRAARGDKLEEVNMSALNSALQNRMRSLGMDPTPKDGSDEASRLGAIKKDIIDTMLAQQKTTGKQMTDADVEKHIDARFAKSTTFRTSFMGISTGTTSQRLLTMKASDIPDETRSKLQMDFKAHGIDAPTEGDLLGAYFKLKQIPFKAPRAPDTPQSKSGTIKGMP